MRLDAAAVPVVHPHRGDWLDILLVVVAAAAAFVGFRRGLLIGGLSLVGFAGGAVLAARFGPRIAAWLVGGASRGDVGGQAALGQRVIALLVVVVFAAAGEAVLVTAGTWVRRMLWASPLGMVDSAGGAVLDVVGVLLVAWLLASALALAPLPNVRDQIRRSLVLNAVNSVVPTQVRVISADLDRLLQQHALPSLAGPFGALPVAPRTLPPPNAGVVPPALHAAGADIVKITGTASCERVQEGSGFVIAADRVLTNAHVVAGVRHPTVALPGSGATVLAARVVLYDPNRDVAVLEVPGLNRSALSFAGTAEAGADAVVAGYPQNGPLTAVPARVEGDQDVLGPNIYDDRTVTRDVYTIRARVRPGNSGGPLLTPSGQVYGVVFAASVDDPDTGYALTASEVAGDVSRGAAATGGLSTGRCD